VIIISLRDTVPVLVITTLASILLFIFITLPVKQAYYLCLTAVVTSSSLALSPSLPSLTRRIDINIFYLLILALPLGILALVSPYFIKEPYIYGTFTFQGQSYEVAIGIPILLEFLAVLLAFMGVTYFFGIKYALPVGILTYIIAIFLDPIIFGKPLTLSSIMWSIYWNSVAAVGILLGICIGAYLRRKYILRVY